MTEEGFQETVIRMRNRTLRLEHEGDPWSKDDLNLLRKLYFDGVDFSVIAVRMGRTELAIMQQVQRPEFRIPQRISHNKEKDIEEDTGTDCPCNGNFRRCPLVKEILPT